MALQSPTSLSFMPPGLGFEMLDIDFTSQQRGFDEPQTYQYQPGQDPSGEAFGGQDWGNMFSPVGFGHSLNAYSNAYTDENADPAMLGLLANSSLPFAQGQNYMFSSPQSQLQRQHAMHLRTFQTSFATAQHIHHPPIGQNAALAPQRGLDNISPTTYSYNYSAPTYPTYAANYAAPIHPGPNHSASNYPASDHSAPIDPGSVSTPQLISTSQDSPETFSTPLSFQRISLPSLAFSPASSYTTASSYPTASGEPMHQASPEASAAGKEACSRRSGQSKACPRYVRGPDDYSLEPFPHLTPEEIIHGGNQTTKIYSQQIDGPAMLKAAFSYTNAELHRAIATLQIQEGHSAKTENCITKRIANSLGDWAKKDGCRSKAEMDEFIQFWRVERSKSLARLGKSGNSLLQRSRPKMRASAEARQARKKKARSERG